MNLATELRTTYRAHGVLLPTQVHKAANALEAMTEALFTAKAALRAASASKSLPPEIISTADAALRMAGVDPHEARP